MNSRSLVIDTVLDSGQKSAVFIETYERRVEVNNAENIKKYGSN